MAKAVTPVVLGADGKHYVAMSEGGLISGEANNPLESGADGGVMLRVSSMVAPGDKVLSVSDNLLSAVAALRYNAKDSSLDLLGKDGVLVSRVQLPVVPGLPVVVEVLEDIVPPAIDGVSYPRGTYLHLRFVLADGSPSDLYISMSDIMSSVTGSLSIAVNGSFVQLLDASGKVISQAQLPSASDMAAIVVSSGGLIKPGGGLEISDGKIAVSCSGITPCIKGVIGELVSAGAGLSLSNNALSVDFSAIPADKMREIVYAMVQEGGGLAVDDNGQLYVDFDSMDQETFDAMLDPFRKSLHLLKWLKSNKTYYVDAAAGSDPDFNAEDAPQSWGEVESQSFASIGACAAYVASNYNVGPYMAYIKVKGGAYGSFTLPEFSRTTGGITLVSDGHVIVKRTTLGSVINALGPRWIMDGDFEVVMEIDCTTLTAVAGLYNPCVQNSGGIFESRGLDVKIKLLGEDSTSKVRTFFGYYCNGGTLTINPSALRPNKMSSINQSNLHTVVGIGAEAGSISLGNTSDTSIDNVFQASGAYTVFARSSGNNSTIVRATAAENRMTFSGSPTGKRFVCNLGGTISTGGAGPDYFPGSTDGTIESTTYSWYK